MIRYRLCGRIDNDEILRFYRHNKIDCFVHTSSMEGLPIAIMEAESAGIPIVAVSAGGVKEEIDGNGIILPLECSADDISDSILSILDKDPADKSAIENKSREIWESKFDAQRNAEAFTKENVVGHNTIIVITEGFPITTNEITFLKSELIEISKRCNKVIIIPRVHYRVSKDDIKNGNELLNSSFNDVDLYSKVTVIPYEDVYNLGKVFRYLLKYAIVKSTKNERSAILQSRQRLIVRYWESAKYYAEGQKFFKWFDKNIWNQVFDEGCLLYTFWNLEPTLGLCQNRDKLGNVTIMTRCHGYDYQDVQWKRSARKPFAETVDKLLDRLVFVSKTGMQEYLSRYGISNDIAKYNYSYLGSADSAAIRGIYEGNSCVNKSDLPYRIVSCSSLIELKRVELIIDALRVISIKRPEMDIDWVHFGDGPLREFLKEKGDKFMKPLMVGEHLGDIELSV